MPWVFNLLTTGLLNTLPWGLQMAQNLTVQQSHCGLKSRLCNRDAFDQGRFIRIRVASSRHTSYMDPSCRSSMWWIYWKHESTTAEGGGPAHMPTIQWQSGDLVTHVRRTMCAVWRSTVKWGMIVYYISIDELGITRQRWIVICILGSTSLKSGNPQGWIRSWETKRDIMKEMILTKDWS